MNVGGAGCARGCATYAVMRWGRMMGDVVRCAACGLLSVGLRSMQYAFSMRGVLCGAVP